MTLQKTLPVLTSIAIILLVAFLRDRSRTAAAILATMPLNIPLALWVVAGSTGDDPRALADFTRTLIISLLPAFLWLGVVYLAVRAGWGLPGAIAAGYGAWAVLMAGLYFLGGLALPN